MIGKRETKIIVDMDMVMEVSGSDVVNCLGIMNVGQ